MLLPSPGALGVRLVGPEDSFDSSRLNRRPSGASVGASPSPEMEAGHARRKVKPAWDSWDCKRRKLFLKRGGCFFLPVGKSPPLICHQGHVSIYVHGQGSHPPPRLTSEERPKGEEEGRKKGGRKRTACAGLIAQRDISSRTCGILAYNTFILVTPRIRFFCSSLKLQEVQNRFNWSLLLKRF